MKRLAILALSVLEASAALAQVGSRLERLEVAIWPEYDRPAVLIMYRGWLPPDEPLPTTVALPIPAGVGAPTAAAKRGPATDLLIAPYTVELEGAWKRVYLQTDLPEIRLEYYVDLALHDPQRRFTFEWPGGPAIGTAAYEVMQPLDASALTATPGSAPPAIAADGLAYQREELGPIPAGGSFFIEVAYQKTTPTLTASALQPVASPAQQATAGGDAGPPAPGDAPAQSPTGQDSVWLVVLPIVFAAGVAAGWLLLSGRRPKPDRGTGGSDHP